MKIGIIVAMSEEFRAVRNCFASSVSGKFGVLRYERSNLAASEFLLVEAGMGFRNSTRAAELLVSCEKPDLLISAGFCGGITSGLNIGDVIVAKQILIANKMKLEEVPVELSDIGLTFLADANQENGKRSIMGGTFVSTPTISSKKRLALMLDNRYQNPVAEMESGAIATVAVKYNIPMLAIRAVSDTAFEELDFSLEDFCDAEMRGISVHKVIFKILKKPGIISQLIRLSSGSRQAAASITAELSRLFSQF